MNLSVRHPIVGKTARPNFTEVRIGEVRLWFSYETPIAFHTSSTGTVVRENEWGSTTGKHLGYLDGGGIDARRARLTGEEFGRHLDMVLNQYRITELELVS